MKTERQIALEQFRDYVIQQAKSNLTRMHKKSSSKLYNSIKGDVKEMPNSIRLGFDMEEYGFFQDKGVSGTKRRYDTPFKYTNKQPPIEPIERWIKNKGIVPRNSKGRFTSKRGLAFAISRSIKEKGIKPSLFFTKPFEKAFKNLPNELIDAFGLDATETFNTIMNENFKKK